MRWALGSHPQTAHPIINGADRVRASEAGARSRRPPRVRSATRAKPPMTTSASRSTLRLRRQPDLGWPRRRHARAISWNAPPICSRTTAPLLMGLLVREAGKDRAQRLGEVREAVDFLRYYAKRGAREFLRGRARCPGPTGEQNELSLHGRGVFMCIAPWNFPLSIFTGQVAAALAAGNSVLAKPAEQTPLIAAAAVRLLHRGGRARQRAAPAAGRRRADRQGGCWPIRGSPASPSPDRPKPRASSIARWPRATDLCPR